VGKTTPRSFAKRMRELVAGHPALETIVQALLGVRAVLLREFDMFEKQVRILARRHEQATLLMTVPAVGPIVALTYATAVDDPARFKSSKAAGPHFGLTPKKYQSGETDRSGPHQRDRRRRGARSALPGGPCYADQSRQRLLATQELGDADRPARRHAQGQGGARAQTRRDPASHARRQTDFQPGRQRPNQDRSGLAREIENFGRAATPGPSQAKSLAGTMDQVRPPSGMWHLTTNP
jgi:hypothetical protein